MRTNGLVGGAGSGKPRFAEQRGRAVLVIWTEKRKENGFYGVKDLNRDFLCFTYYHENPVDNI